MARGQGRGGLTGCLFLAAKVGSKAGRLWSRLGGMCGTVTHLRVQYPTLNIMSFPFKQSSQVS